jgi:hypothetical protein
MMRMTRDAERALLANLFQDVIRRLVGRDVALDVERNDVRVLPAVQLVLRDLGAGDDELIVFAACAVGFTRDIVEIGGELSSAMPKLRQPSVAIRPALASRSRFIRM